MHEALGHSTHYELLQVARDVSPVDLKPAYYRFSKDFHPDRASGTRAGESKHLSDQVYALFSGAFETLSDPRERAELLARHRPDARVGVAGEACRALAAEALGARAALAMDREDWREFAAGLQRPSGEGTSLRIQSSLAPDSLTTLAHLTVSVWI